MKSKIIAIIALIIFSVACSTKKNTAIRRSYHNLTSHYNVYFNGKESFKDGILYLEDNHKDNYSDILNVFLYDDPSFTSVSSQMKRAEDKATKLIKKHSITVKPKRKKGGMSEKDKAFYARKEFNNWVDDAYLLMGKSFFIRREFLSAEENFNWILTEYPKMNARYDALVWLARTYIQKKDYSKALDFLQRAEAEKKFPEKRLNRELFPTYADYYIKQERYQEAISWLELALKEKGKRLYKRRYKYIIAQIYQKLGQDKKAYQMYKEVIKMRPSYDMEFSAKIQMATLFDHKKGDSKEIRKFLHKMLKDEKNIDYQDQIYYALAEIDMKEHQEDAAVDNYKLSANTSVSNDNQRGLSYLALGDIYFERLDYPLAKAYYDSTRMYLSKSNKRYEESNEMADKLTELVNYSETIYLQDSLLNLAQMPANKRDAIISEIIQKIIEEEKRQAEEERQRRMDLAQYNENNRPGMPNASRGGGKWYFYNPSAIGIGQADFERKWGNRRLEDNWRRRNKTVSEFANAEGDSAVSDSTQQVVDLKSKAYYISQLPMTDSAKVASNLLIEESLYNLARVYRSQFIDYQKSTETFLKLLERYPETEYKLDAYYQLYQLYELQKQPEKSLFYKNLILKKFPDSTPAKIINDPNYLAKMEAEKNKTKSIYEKTFKAFKLRKFSKVVEYCRFVEQKNPETPLMSKFDLLKAQSVGASGNVDQMKVLLTDIKTKYPKTEESELADFMLNRIEAGGFKNFVAEGRNQAIVLAETTGKKEKTDTQTSESEETSIEEELEPKNLYEYHPEQAHLYVMAATGEISDMNRLKFNIIKYNMDNFLMFDFSVADKKLTSDTKLIVVKPLNDAKEAYKYLKLIRRNKEVYSEFQSLEMKQFIISPENLKILLKDGNLSRYVLFFEQNYTK